MKNRDPCVTHECLNNKKVALEIFFLRWKETKTENKRRSCEETKVGISFCVSIRVPLTENFSAPSKRGQRTGKMKRRRKENVKRFF